MSLSLLIADLHAEPNRINYWTQPGVPPTPSFPFSKKRYLGPFALNETRDMLNGIGQLMGRCFDDPLVKAIHSESGGYPILSRQIASVIARRREGLKELTLDSETRELLNDLFYEEPYLDTYCDQSIWEDMQCKGPQAAAPVLLVLACIARPYLCQLSCGSSELTTQKSTSASRSPHFAITA